MMSPSLDKQTACEDLKALERRLTEIVGHMQPAAIKWRFILALITMCTSVGAYQWLQDPGTREVSLAESLSNHLLFSVSVVLLLILFLCGIHRRVVSPHIVASRCRQVLNEFNMSCDDTGKLILKPRPASP